MSATTERTVKANATIRHHLDDAVTEHMRKEFVRLRVQQTVGEALESLRQNPPNERIIYFYVVDDQDRLQGVVPTRRLLLSQPETRMGDIMVREVISIPSRATVLDACEFFVLHRLLAFPVVDEQRRMVGVVDVELYTSELSEIDRSERQDYLFQLIGVHLIEAQQAAPLTAFRSRFPWLLCNIAGGVLAAFLSGIFQAQLQKVVALALFIPVVLALAESVAIQSVSLSLQLLSGLQPTWRSLMPKIRRELVTGVLLGVASGLPVALVAIIWLGQLAVVLSVLGGIAGGVAVAAVLGIAITNVLHILQRDPKVAAGPIALASADMITLIIYFNLARWLVG